MKITKEEYDAHPCAGKHISVSYSNGSYSDDDAADSLGPLKPEDIPGSGSMKRSSYYYVCSRDCDGQIPKCLYVIRPRCISDNVGPTCLEIVEEFVLKVVLVSKPTGYNKFIEILNLYSNSCLGSQWICSGCEYWERRDGESAFCSTHGIKTLLSGIYSFLTYFLIRKCMTSDNEIKTVAKCMKMLVLFCIEKQYCTESKGKEVIDQFWKSCSNFEGKKIAEGLNELKNQRYWNNLGEEKIDVNSKKRSSQEAGFNSDDDGDDFDDDDSDYEETINTDFPLTLEKVKKEGWIFSTGFYDEENKNREILVRLPDALRKKGKKGMSISCMALGKLKNGVWAPFNPYDNEYACANVYPE